MRTATTTMSRKGRGHTNKKKSKKSKKTKKQKKAKKIQSDRFEEQEKKVTFVRKTTNKQKQSARKRRKKHDNTTTKLTTVNNCRLCTRYTRSIPEQYLQYSSWSLATGMDDTFERGKNKQSRGLPNLNLRTTSSSY